MVARATRACHVHRPASPPPNKRRRARPAPLPPQTRSSRYDGVAQAVASATFDGAGALVLEHGGAPDAVATTSTTARCPRDAAAAREMEGCRDGERGLVGAVASFTLEQRGGEPGQVAARSVLLGEAHRDVADLGIGVVERCREALGDRDLVARGAREGDDGLVPDLGGGGLEACSRARACAGVADLAEGREGHLTDVGVAVLDGDEEAREGLVGSEVGERQGGRGPHGARRIGRLGALPPQGLLEPRDGAAPRTEASSRA